MKQEQLANLTNISIYLPFDINNEIVGKIVNLNENRMDIVFSSSFPKTNSQNDFSYNELLDDDNNNSNNNLINNNNNNCIIFNNKQLLYLFYNSKDLLNKNNLTISIIWYDPSTRYIHSKLNESMKSILSIISPHSSSTISNNITLNNNNNLNNSIAEQSEQQQDNDKLNVFSQLAQNSLFIKQFKQKTTNSSFFNLTLDFLLALIFLNFIWFLLNDKHIQLLKEEILYGYHQVVTIILDYINWLTKESRPAGLKLNHSLNQLFGLMAGGGIKWWNSLFELANNFLDYLLSFSPLSNNFLFLRIILTISTCFGISLFFSLCYDLFSLITLHILLFYRMCRRVYQILIEITESLFRLFRGKKYNPLRERIDHCDNYSHDQLILGTLLLTICIFLYPTVAVYYFTFTFLFLMVKAVKKFLFILVKMLNEFPLELLFNYKGCRNQGIYFKLISDSKESSIVVGKQKEKQEGSCDSGLESKAKVISLLLCNDSLGISQVLKNFLSQIYQEISLIPRIPRIVNFFKGS